jgi:hypothetical protein
LISPNLLPAEDFLVALDSSDWFTSGLKQSKLLLLLLIASLLASALMVGLV